MSSDDPTAAPIAVAVAGASGVDLNALAALGVVSVDAAALAAALAPLEARWEALRQGHEQLNQQQRAHLQAQEDLRQRTEEVRQQAENVNQLRQQLEVAALALLAGANGSTNAEDAVEAFVAGLEAANPQD